MLSQLHSTAVLLESPRELRLKRLLLDEPTDADVVVQIEWSGISTGTEKMLWNGTMPEFPGMEKIMEAAEKFYGFVNSGTKK